MPIQQRMDGADRGATDGGALGPRFLANLGRAPRRVTAPNAPWCAEFTGRKINLIHVFAGQQVGVTQVDERLWLVTFMHYDLGYFDDETCRLEPIQSPLGATVLPMYPE